METLKSGDGDAGLAPVVMRVCTRAHVQVTLACACPPVLVPTPRPSPQAAGT